MRLTGIVREIITLGTARGRLLAWAGLTAVIFVVPYHWLENLSLWQRLGWEGAPSIGLTRAYWLLIHGDPVAAWHRNWLIFAVCTVGAVVLVRDALYVNDRQKLRQDLH